MDDLSKNEDILFLKTVLELIPILWLNEAEKCTQKTIALKIGVSNSYLSKAKFNQKYAVNLRRKLLALVNELGGEYNDQKKCFYDRAKNNYPLSNELSAESLIQAQFGVDSDLFKSQLSKTKTIRVLTTWAGETYSNLVRLLEEDPAISKKVEKIEVLLLHPDSTAAHLRSKGLGHNPEKGFNSIIGDLQEFVNTPKEIKSKLEIRLYNQLPSVKLIMMDDLIVVGFFLFKEIARRGHHIVFNPRNNPEFALDLIRHYRLLWNTAERFEFEKAEGLLEKWKHPSFKRYNKSRYSNFEGVFRLYYPEQYSQDENYKEHKISTTIGCNIIEISGFDDGLFSCKMKSHGSDNLYEGELINIKFNNPDYMILELRNSQLNRYLNLVFYIKNAKNNNQYFGMFSVIYGNTSNLGNGNAILIPMDESFDKLSAESIDSQILDSDSTNEHHNYLEPNSIAYLIDKRRSLSLPIMHAAELKEQDHISGVFKIYSCGSTSAEQKDFFMNIGIIEISSNGMVRFKNKKGGHEGVGQAFKTQSSLHIELVNSHSNIQRFGHFIFQIGSNPALISEEGAIYTGISASTTWKDELPVSSRLIIECSTQGSYESLDPQKVHFATEEWQQIPEAIRDSFSSLENNFIGFFNRRGRIYNLNDLKSED